MHLNKWDRRVCSDPNMLIGERMCERSYQVVVTSYGTTFIKFLAGVGSLDTA